MEELRKIRRVVQRHDPTGPHEVLLVLDATTGQNALIQAQAFSEAVEVTAICLTKLDGTSKGGIVFAICDQLGLPVLFVGTGERAEDLSPSRPRISLKPSLPERLPHRPSSRGGTWPPPTCVSLVVNVSQPRARRDD